MLQYNITKHGVAFPSKVLSRQGGKHIYNIQLDEATLGYCDNGWFVGKGKFIDLDLYEETTPGSVSGTIVGMAKNGNYYVEIDSCDEGTLFVYHVPMIEEQYNRAFQMEDNYTNAPDQVVRSYQLAPGDIIELSEKAFASKPSKADSTVTVTLQTIASAKYAQQLGE